MVEDLELQQDPGQAVVALDDALCLGTLQDRVVLLERVHWLLDPPEQLPSPRDLTCHVIKTNRCARDYSFKACCESSDK